MSTPADVPAPTDRTLLTIVMVTGNRDWKDEALVYKVMQRHLELHLLRKSVVNGIREPREVASKRFVLRHGANNAGVDAIVNRWGIERGVTVERFHAEWRLPNGGTDYSAGPRRNREMAEAEPRAHLCQAFWDGKLRTIRNRQVSGTRDAITVAVEAGLHVRICPLLLHAPEPEP